MLIQSQGFQITNRLRKGAPMPDWYAQGEPQITEAQTFYVKAFWDLSTCRSFGLGVGPIPWRDIAAYAREAGLDRDVRAAFVAIIRRMDAAYLERRREELKSEGSDG